MDEITEKINAVRYLADLTHAGSKAVLIWAIIHNRSSEGISLLTQCLYIIVFLTRYVDLFGPQSFDQFVYVWNFIFKLLYISSSFFIVFLMLRMFPRTREREASWKLAIWSLLGCLVTTPLTNLIFNQLYFSVSEHLWIFSIELESVCILPQLLLLRQTAVPTVLDSYYLLMLGSYRLLYIINWIVKGATGIRVSPISVVFGVVQTLFYLDFAWVYYSRQRVKLRGGAVVDSDDLGKSVLVRRLIGTKSQNPEDDTVDDEQSAFLHEEEARGSSANHGFNNRWGARGISISADDTLHEHDRRGPIEIRDPAHFEDDEDDIAPPPPAKNDHPDDGDSSSPNAWMSPGRES